MHREPLAPVAVICSPQCDELPALVAHLLARHSPLPRVDTPVPDRHRVTKLRQFKLEIF
jgi:hypothetical protein